MYTSKRQKGENKLFKLQTGACRQRENKKNA